MSSEAHLMGEPLDMIDAQVTLHHGFLNFDRQHILCTSMVTAYSK